MTEFDAMVCSACGKEERASEGYPCPVCGNFLCLICQFRGVSRCNECEAKAQEEAKAEAAKETGKEADGPSDSSEDNGVSSPAASDANGSEADPHHEG